MCDYHTYDVRTAEICGLVAGHLDDAVRGGTIMASDRGMRLLAMAQNTVNMNRLLKRIFESLDVPASYYERARDRYVSLAEWFHRPDSKIAKYDPAVYPQGSFRLGTVIPPLLRGEEYDLDLVCVLVLSKVDISQQALDGRGDCLGSELQAAGFLVLVVRLPASLPREQGQGQGDVGARGIA